LILLVALLTAGLTAGMAEAPPPEDTMKEAMVVNPGSAGWCSHDFVVENSDTESAELQLLLGNEDYMTETIQPDNAKAYGLHHNLSEAKEKGKNVEMDDWATIINHGEKGSVKMYCVD
jgi:hypothetical protein